MMRAFPVMTLLFVIFFETMVVGQAVIIKVAPFYSPKPLDKEMNDAKANLARIIKETKCAG